MLRFIPRLLVVCVLLAFAPHPAAAQSGPRKLNGAVPAGKQVQEFRLSPRGTFALYTVGALADSTFQLYSVPVAGGAPKLLADALPDRDLQFVRFAPDDSRVAFLLFRAGSFGVRELYSAPLDGSASPIKLNQTLQTSSQGIFSFVLSADGSTAIYTAPQDTTDRYEVYSVPLAGPASARMKLNGALLSGTNVEPFAVNGGQVAFVAEQQNGGAGLFLAPIDGGSAAAKLATFPLKAFGRDSLRFTPDGSRVLYAAGSSTSDDAQLYSVAAGSAPILLNAALATSEVVQGDYLLSADSRRVVYTTYRANANRFEVFSVPVDGSSAAVKLNQALGSNRSVSLVQLSADSTRVVYSADIASDNVDELWSVPIDGPVAAGTRISAVLGGAVYEYFLSADSSVVVYAAERTSTGVFEIHSVPLAGPQSADTTLSTTVVAPNTFDPTFYRSPDDALIIYRASSGLYSVPRSGPASKAVRISDTLPSGASIGRDVALGPDGALALYRVVQGNSADLYVAAVPNANPTKNVFLPLMGRA